MTDHHQDSVRMTGSHADSETVKHPPPPPLSSIEVGAPFLLEQQL